MKYLAVILFFLVNYSIYSQSILELESQHYSKYHFSSESEFNSLNPYSYIPQKIDPPLLKHIFGWNPYWVGTAYQSYNYGLLNTIAYFSYEVDTATGSYKDIHFWKTTNLIPIAHTYGVKVVLTVTNFGATNNTKILSNAAKRERLIDSLIALVQYRNADGVNIDFESVGSSQRQNLVTFMTALSNRFHTQIPGSKVSICLPAVDWNNSFDIPALNNVCDQLIMMGYDYYWSTAPNAGPPAPLLSGSVWGSYNVTNSVNSYLQKGVTPSKFLLGVPYYGYQWPTTSGNLNATTTGSATAYQYSSMKTRAMSYGRLWDGNSQTPWYKFQTTSWYQGWYDDSVSLGYKYDLVNTKNISGIGIWALSYDGSNNELWNTISRKFSINPVRKLTENAEQFYLAQNYPNPFNPMTKIRFTIPASTTLSNRNESTSTTRSNRHVRLVIYNSLGQVVETPVNEKLRAGEYEVEWNGSNYPSGVYYYKLQIQNSKLQIVSEDTKRMLLIK
jgi:spore germination protein YaaH